MQVETLLLLAPASGFQQGIARPISRSRAGRLLGWLANFIANGVGHHTAHYRNSPGYIATVFFAGVGFDRIARLDAIIDTIRNCERAFFKAKCRRSILFDGIVTHSH